MANLFQHGSVYKLFRPVYPERCFKSLEEQLKRNNVGRGIVVDVACGSGQASVGLAKIFDKVIAFDSSVAQLKEAEKRDNIEYRVGSAETLTDMFEKESVDAVVVAQAMHWFDIPKFYRDANFVLKKGGILAIWGYSLVKMPNSQADADVHYLYENEMGKYWDPRRFILDRGYVDHFPPSNLFNNIEHVNDTNIYWNCNLASFLNYLKTWSSYQTYLKTAEGKKRSPDVIEETGLKLLKSLQSNGVKSLTEGEFEIIWPMTVIYAFKPLNDSTSSRL